MLQQAVRSVNRGSCILRKSTPLPLSAAMHTLPVDRFLVGDCVDVMRDFPPDSIDLTVTSPPYDKLRNYEGYEFDAEAVGRQLLRVMKPGGVVVWVVGDHINRGRSMTSFPSGPDV